jgi:hypothetical protein
MMKGLKFAVVSAIFVLPFACPRDAFSWDALTYQEAARLCVLGNSYACKVMTAYQAAIARSGSGGSPADRWVGSGELTRGGLRGVRRGPLSTYDFVR